MLKLPKYFLLVFSLIASLSLIVKVKPVWAAVLQLTSIGNSIVTGKTFTTWTYSGENPVLVGKAAAEDEVVILLNSAAHQVFADSLGDWTFTPTTLLVGTHSVAIAAGGESKDFTLIIASSSGATSTSSAVTPTPTGSASAAVADAEVLPQTGGVSLTLVVVFFGVALAGLGMMGWSSAQAVAANNHGELDEE